MNINMDKDLNLDYFNYIRQGYKKHNITKNEIKQ